MLFFSHEIKSIFCCAIIQRVPTGVLERQCSCEGCGEDVPNAVLTEQEVRDMRSRREQGDSLPSLARRYSVAVNLVWRITKRLAWKHVH